MIFQQIFVVSVLLWGKYLFFFNFNIFQSFWVLLLMCLWRIHLINLVSFSLQKNKREWSQIYESFSHYFLYMIWLQIVSILYIFFYIFIYTTRQLGFNYFCSSLDTTLRYIGVFFLIYIMINNNYITKNYMYIFLSCFSIFVMILVQGLLTFIIVIWML